MRLRDLRTVNVKGKRVLLRVDYNIAVANGRVRETHRLEASLATIRWLRSHGATVIILSHRGRPKKADPALSLRPMVQPLSRLLGVNVQWIGQAPTSAGVCATIKTLPPRSVCLLENLRFQSGEDRNAASFARSLARFGDLYVNDAFAVSHRAAASVDALPKLLPAYAGFNLQAEVKQLSRLREHPQRPYIAILGGAKISTKLGLVKKLLKQADHVLLGGALANTVLEAEGLAIGSSLSEPSMLKQTKGLTVQNRHLHIPCDLVVVRGKPRLKAKTAVRAAADVMPNETIVDIGPDTIELFSRVIRQAKTIVWNGPMGVYELRPFAAGTRALARVIAKSPAVSMVGGGETVDAVRSQHLEKKFTFVSTGGGAMLEFLEGKRLPGVAAVQQR